MSEEQDLIEDEELDLSTLPDDELVLQMHDDLYDGLKEEIEEGTNILLEVDGDLTKYSATRLWKECVSWALIFGMVFCLFLKSCFQQIL